MAIVESFACVVGGFYLSYLLLKSLKFIFEAFQTIFSEGNVNFKSFGEWAVVTGSTSGIGKSYAKQLAAKGLNIILMSRCKEKLEQTASEIEKDHHVKTKIIQVDFSSGHEIYEPIAKELEGLEIGILVNNVATGLPYPALLHDLSIEVMWSQVNTNIMSTVMLTRLLIPEMVQRKKGLIINVSSYTSMAPYSLTGIYAASKACMVKFSECLETEYADKGIIIQCVVPLWVSTNMSLLEPSLFVPHPDDYVRGALKKVGMTSPCCGYWSHEVQGFIMRCLPRSLAVKIGRDVMLELRERSLRHLDEKKEN